VKPFANLNFIVLSLMLSCESFSIPDDSPDCLVNLLRTSKPQPVEINSYLYNGKTVYLVVSGCCDFYNSLYDETCQYLCAPSGGFSGKGDGKCADFADTATHQKLIWKAD